MTKNNTRRGNTQQNTHKNCHSKFNLESYRLLLYKGRSLKYGMTPCFITTQGFTLIELLVVVLIIGILAAVALPQYNKAVEKSRAVQALTSLDALAQAQEAYFLSHGNYAVSMRNLDIEVPTVTNWMYDIQTENYDEEEDDSKIMVQNERDLDLFFIYYFGSKQKACMARSEYAHKICQLFAGVSQDCRGIDKSDGYECYYLN